MVSDRPAPVRVARRPRGVRPPPALDRSRRTEGGPIPGGARRADGRRTTTAGRSRDADRAMSGWSPGRRGRPSRDDRLDPGRRIPGRLSRRDPRACRGASSGRPTGGAGRPRTRPAGLADHRLRPPEPAEWRVLRVGHARSRSMSTSGGSRASSWPTRSGCSKVPIFGSRRRASSRSGRATRSPWTRSSGSRARRRGSRRSHATRASRCCSTVTRVLAASWRTRPVAGTPAPSGGLR